MTVLGLNHRFRRGRAAVGVALVLASVATGFVAGEIGGTTAEAATIGALEVEPGSGGTDIEPLAMSMTEACPETADSFLVQIAGGGFPEGSNAVGLTPFDTPGQVLDHFLMGGTWNIIAENNGAELPLDGVASLRLVCAQESTTDVGDFTATVTFTAPESGTNSTFTMGGQASPTTTPDASPTPTPEGSPTPTPDASPTPTPDGSPTPRPDGSATPSPTPCPTAEPPTPSPTSASTPTATPGQASPTPSPSPTETPTPSLTGTDDCPTPGPDGSPTPTPNANGDDNSSGDDNGGSNGNDENGDGGPLPATGADPSPLLLLAAFLLTSGVLLIGLAWTPSVREGRELA